MTEHFSEWEFRCRCGCGEMRVSSFLLEGLEAMRSIVERPIFITSGCRCPVHNARVGGHVNSRHLTRFGSQLRKSDAADIVVAGYSVRRIFRVAREVECFSDGGIGVYRGEGFLHVDVGLSKKRWYRARRGEPMTKVPQNFY